MPGAPHPKRRADALDAEIGRRIRARRNECGMSQTALAGKLGISFQQVQKYEMGTNRVSAGRLQRVCDALQVPVTFFYDSLAAPPDASRSGIKATKLFNLLQRRDVVKLLTSFSNIRHRPLRRALLEVVESIAKPTTPRRT